jgi:hypothetical protein
MQTIQKPFVVVLNANGTATVNGNAFKSLPEIIAEYGPGAGTACHVALLTLLQALSRGTNKIVASMASAKKSLAQAQTILDGHASALQAELAVAGDVATKLANIAGLSTALSAQTSESRKAAYAKKLAEAKALVAKLQAQAPE